MLDLSFLPYLTALLALTSAASVVYVQRLRTAQQAQQQLHEQAQDEWQQQQQQQTAQLASLEQQLAEVTSNLQEQRLQQTRLEERDEYSREQRQQLQQQLTDTLQQQQRIQQQLAQAQQQLATEQEARQQEQRNSEEKLALLAESKEQMLKEFENLSNRIYEQKQKQFSEQSQKGLDTLLNPFKEQLEGLRKRVDDVHVADAKDRTELKTQIENLHKLNQQITAEAHALTTALRGEKKMQGNWGEMVLETVLDRSGLRKGEEYVREQVHQDDSGKTYRPDVIINLPEGKHIVVDAKVSLNAYTDYVNATDDSEREAAARRHTDAIRNHIRGLSEKAYQQLQGINSPDFVFLFMPVEPAFMLAFQQDEGLFNEAFERRIVVVTPTTLLATLRTVASIWAIERRNRSTEKLAEQAGKVYDKLAIVVEKFERVGSQLSTVQKSYDDAWNSMKSGRGNLLSQADNFRKLGVRAKKDLDKKLVEEATAEADLFDALEHRRDEPLLEE
ncbi:DNA recombination protein RmuC [Thalassolituus marinus]|uniref:DNA recombination protein RmuC n=1 Tax=Thalassolituus marinus TaxID=671053 RepID=A0ABS7ZPL8_9GAMM|nr:DNA recombination protein RmuC [Thalassolituus marinus]MCA6063564.1 DNA recombination protein RmuC [Thalassolituus marinus]